jgi:hypothetical protein
LVPVVLVVKISSKEILGHSGEDYYIKIFSAVGFFCSKKSKISTLSPSIGGEKLSKLEKTPMSL